MRTRTACILLGCLAAALSLAATGRGAGISPDSCHYMSMAENLLAGNGPGTSITRWEDTGDTAPLSAWPPGFPLHLAALRWIGLSPEGSARTLLALSFAAVVLLTFLLAAALEEAVARRDGRPVRPSCSVVAGAAALLSVPLVQLSAWTWSDLPFIAWSLLAVLACLKVGNPDARIAGRWLAVGVVACALATMVRYAGVILWAALVFRAWRIPAGGPGLRRRTIRWAFLLPVLPFAAWLVRNRMATGTTLYGRPATVTGSAPVLVLETVQAALADLLPFPLYGHSLGDRYPWRAVAATIVLATAVLLALLPGFSLSRIRKRLQGQREAGFLLGTYGILILGIAASAVVRDLPPHRIEQRLFAPALPLLLALGSVFIWPALAERGKPSGPFLRGARVAALVWVAYSVAATAACVLFSRVRPGFADERLRTAPSSRFLRESDAPRFATDFDVGVWYLTRRPVKLLPLADRRRAVEELAAGGFDGALVLYKGDLRWSPSCVTLEGLVEAGMGRAWNRIAEFPDCEVFVRRR